ncbi:ABC transporter permease [uncultured Alistipes sp.]|uniref:ABC transporter permease n=1 Tax=uncultured Alistipes sp. TaxID=538949 RepID=UPI00260A1B7A|nr:ABC transporter permease [uncultured Alistipes sp.]
MTLLWRLLRCHLSPAQLVGFALAGVVGMAILLTSWQAYRDIRPLFSSSDSFLRGDFLVLSKRVGALQTLGIGSTDFTPAEIADLEAQPFVRAVGAFTPADYRIAGSIGAGGMRLSTYLFFEAVPDRFLDIRPGEWHYEAGSREVPIIIPRNYVNLYNYGFARSQGLPQLSEGLFRHVGIDLEIEGGGRRETFGGRIVGLSNRLNTILVPESFIRWSNDRFGRGGEARNPARVIVETTGPVDAAVTEYLAARGYETEGDVHDDGKAARMLRLAAGGVGGVGLLFSMMAFYVLILSLFLVLQRSSDRVRDLLLIGYAPRQVARPYVRLALGLNCAVTLVALVAVRVVRSAYLPLLGSLQEGYRPAAMWPTLLCGVVLCGVMVLFDAAAVRRRIARLRPDVRPGRRSA